MDGADFPVDEIGVNVVVCDGICDGFETGPLVSLVSCVDVEIEPAASIGGQQFFPGADGDDYGGGLSKDVDCVAGCRVYFDEVLNGRFLDEEVQRGDIGWNDGFGIIGAYARSLVNRYILIDDRQLPYRQVVE